jgi:hypothetical protein
VGRSKERFAFLLVSENELLTEIAKDEDSLYVKLSNMLFQLTDGEKKLVTVNQDLNSSEPKFSAMSVRVEEIQQAVEKGQTTTEEVYKDYLRVLTELETNRVNNQYITRVRQICDQLGKIAGKDFEDTKGGLIDYRKALDSPESNQATKTALAKTAGEEARRRMDALINDLRTVLGAMEGLADINKLIKTLKEIEDAEQREIATLERLYKELENKILNELGGALDKPKEEKKP